MLAPTVRQLEVFGFIREFVARHQRSPTFRDIATRFGFNVNAAARHVAALEQKRLIERERHKARAIRLTG